MNYATYGFSRQQLVDACVQRFAGIVKAVRTGDYAMAFVRLTHLPIFLELLVIVPEGTFASGTLVPGVMRWPKPQFHANTVSYHMEERNFWGTDLWTDKALEKEVYEEIAADFESLLQSGLLVPSASIDAGWLPFESTSQVARFLKKNKTRFKPTSRSTLDRRLNDGTATYIKKVGDRIMVNLDDPVLFKPDWLLEKREKAE